MSRHFFTIKQGTWHLEEKDRGCGECQTSCQSACKTSCTVGNQTCRQEEGKK